VALTTYLDASAIVKILLREADADTARALWRTSGRRATSVVAYVEARAAIAAAARDRRIDPAAVDSRRIELDRRWRQCEPVALDDQLLRLAGSIADSDGLRALDAIHLATALQLGISRTVFVTWDRRLAASAARLGLAVAPATLA
jgi:uncharacterized protein